MFFLFGDLLEAAATDADRLFAPAEFLEIYAGFVVCGVFLIQFENSDGLCDAFHFLRFPFLQYNIGLDGDFVNSYYLVFRFALSTLLYNSHIYSLSIIATDETIKKNRDQVKRFVGASVRGIAWAIENPGRAVEILRKHNPATNAGLMRKAWEMNIDSLLTPEAQKIGVSMMSEEKMRRTRDLMAKYSNLKMAVPVKDLYTNEFVPRLFPKRGM